MWRNKWTLNAQICTPIRDFSTTKKNHLSDYEKCKITSLRQIKKANKTKQAHTHKLDHLLSTSFRLLFSWYLFATVRVQKARVEWRALTFQTQLNAPIEHLSSLARANPIELHATLQTTVFIKEITLVIHLFSCFAHAYSANSISQFYNNYLQKLSNFFIFLLCISIFIQKKQVPLS